MGKHPIVTIKNFSKSFHSNKVIKDLSFEVQRGEIFAFIGANGSGKTTTLRTLLNIYHPDEGKLLINGKTYSPDRTKIIGYLPEERGLYTTSKVLETMVYFGQLKGMTKGQAEKEALIYLKKVELINKKDETIKRLSSGQQQKIQLGMTILNKPKLLILDEPTKGLDPVNRELLINLLLELNQKGATIIFSTHQMEEAEKIAQRILMIKDGQKALYGDLSDIKEMFGSNTLYVEYSGQFPENKKLYQAIVNPKVAEITPEAGVNTEEVLKYLINTRIKIHSFKKTTPSLHQIFIRISKENV